MYLLSSKWGNRMKLSDAERKRRSEAMMGDKNPSHRRVWTYEERQIRAERFRKIVSGKQGEKSPSWKGDDVGYAGVHAWLWRHFEKPEFCDNCHSDRFIDWSNISGEYKRDRSDWQALCRGCHMEYDLKILGVKRRQR